MSAYKLLRGGSWFINPGSCRSACRNDALQDLRIDLVGFRVVSLSQPAYQISITMENLNIEMVTIPAGEFVMGSSGSNVPKCETPAHQVSVSEFLMSKTAITQAQWREVASWTEQHGEKWGRQLDPDPSHFKGDDLPVECVSWHDAMEFCNRLSQRTGRRFSLPSEAQWEYACRAGSDTAYPWGDEISVGHANYSSYSESDGTTPVGTFPANRFGLKDMNGNVWEWCLDSWHASYEGAPTDGSAWIE